MKKMRISGKPILNLEDIEEMVNDIDTDSVQSGGKFRPKTNNNSSSPENKQIHESRSNESISPENKQLHDDLNKLISLYDEPENSLS